jgi:hypothetical protein
MKCKWTLGLLVIALNGCGKAPESQGISPQRMADSIHIILEADRTVYTQQVVNRLTLDEKVIKASEHWREDKALVLPAQMFRMGAELVNEKDLGMSYALISEWAINKKNLPRTDGEKHGMQALIQNPAQPFYTEEALGGKRYFTAIYPDKAVADACVQCHNDHKDSPRKDFKKGDIMGAVVVRLAL